jgi:hypothetical protein
MSSQSTYLGPTCIAIMIYYTYLYCNLQVCAFISIMFIFISTVVATLNSVPSLLERDEFGNVTGDNIHLTHIETSCVCWFTIEYLGRLWSTPDR